MGELSGHLENQPTAAVAAEPWLEYLRDRVISPPRSHLDKRWQLFNLWNDYLMNTFIAAVYALLFECARKKICSHLEKLCGRSNAA